MTDKVLCPYCWAKMVVIMSIYLDSPGWVGRTLCKGCDALGPRVTGFKKKATKAEVKAAALAAAQARYLPPNRPLTLDEVNALPADDDGYTPCFLEIEPNWYVKDTDDFDPRLRADAISTSSSLGGDTYGKNYRAWLRKPTQAEMDAAEWGDAE